MRNLKNSKVYFTDKQQTRCMYVKGYDQVLEMLKRDDVKMSMCNLTPKFKQMETQRIILPSQMTMKQLKDKQKTVTEKKMSAFVKGTAPPSLHNEIQSQVKTISSSKKSSRKVEFHQKWK